MRRSVIRNLLSATAFVAFAVVHAGAEEQSILKTQADRINYAIGVNIVGNIKQQGVDIDLELVIQGMKDAYAGGKLLMSDDELRKAVSQYQVAARQKRAQIQAKTAEDNRKEGEAFLAENKKKDGVVTLPSGLQYQILKPGDGKKPTDSDRVECRYRGFLINGKEFENSSEPGVSPVLKVSAMSPGWREALKLMPTGSMWRLFVPSELAYGARGKGSAVGPNATLIYEIELIAVK